jgi:hypothetical protein
VPAEPRRDSVTGGNWTALACGQYRAGLSPAAAGTITQVPESAPVDIELTPGAADAARHDPGDKPTAGRAAGPGGQAAR